HIAQGDDTGHGRCDAAGGVCRAVSGCHPTRLRVLNIAQRKGLPAACGRCRVVGWVDPEEAAGLALPPRPDAFFARGSERPGTSGSGGGHTSAQAARDALSSALNWLGDDATGDRLGEPRGRKRRQLSSRGGRAPGSGGGGGRGGGGGGGGGGSRLGGLEQGSPGHGGRATGRAPC